MLNATTGRQGRIEHEGERLQRTSTTADPRTHKPKAVQRIAGIHICLSRAWVQPAPPSAMPMQSLRSQHNHKLHAAGTQCMQPCVGSTARAVPRQRGSSRGHE